MFDTLIHEVKSLYTSMKAMPSLQKYQGVINVLLIGISAWMMLNVVKIATGAETPGVVVLSGSMEPAFSRGDLLGLAGRNVRQQQVIVYELKNQKIPIVHRVLEHHIMPNETRIVTKGDANDAHDHGLYIRGGFDTLYITKEQALGTVRFYMPWAGGLTILMADYPSLKYLLLSILAVYAFVGRER